jgi:hypothetical protein
MTAYIRAIAIYTLTIDIYTPTISIYMLTIAIYTLTIDIYTLTIDIYMLTIAIYTLTIDIYMLTIAIYMLTIDILSGTITVLFFSSRSFFICLSFLFYLYPTPYKTRYNHPPPLCVQIYLYVTGISIDMDALTGKSLNFRQFINYSYPELRLSGDVFLFQFILYIPYILLRSFLMPLACIISIE